MRQWWNSAHQLLPSDRSICAGGGVHHTSSCSDRNACASGGVRRTSSSIIAATASVVDTSHQPLLRLQHLRRWWSSSKLLLQCVQHLCRGRSTPPAKIISYSSFLFGLSAAELIRFPIPIRFAPRIHEHRKFTFAQSVDRLSTRDNVVDRHCPCASWRERCPISSQVVGQIPKGTLCKGSGRK